MAKTAIELALELADIFDKQKELAAREVQIRQELNQLQSVLIEMQKPMSEILRPNHSGLTAQPMSQVSWSPAWKIDKKTANILRRTKRIMYNREVAEYIAELESNKDSDYLKLLVRKFSAVVGGKAKNGRVFKRIEIDGVLYYGLADWFNTDGSVKHEYAIAE